MTSTEPWVCVFGSNLFYQSDPDEDRTRSSTTKKKIIHPRKLKQTRITKDARSTSVVGVEILHVTDSQTLVHYQQVDENTPESCTSYLEIWGFDEENQSTEVKTLSNNCLTSHPLDQVKKWLGRTKILGYLARDGTINPINMNTPASTGSPTRNSARYQAVTISHNGEVLAAVLDHESTRTPSNLKTEDQSTHRLELWSSFQELLDFCLKGVRTNSNPKSISLDSHPSGEETEIQLSSGASHFLILTHTPSTGSIKGAEDPDYHSTLHAFGDNRFGQLGIGSRSIAINEPQMIENLPALSTIDCGLFHSVALGRDGELYTFGHNRKGQCGVGSSSTIDTTTPILVDIGGNGEAGEIIDVIDARCGSEHTVVLTSSGVWLAGSNALGQLGMEDASSQFEFQKNEHITMGDHASTTAGWKIQAGRWNTFVWTNS
ncbi:uncharacterized protein PGTG_18813 [Puccinia graminis f. sp. tritici CRL 75-36-700-3]|uniref:Uncharacterized protein n=1 Tax=Puccinia graminis f. sp. tritici (strain CRL 75-36-700-3 / race SCCL) TaxID=418459 RepID=E3L8M0_PUCGT|nr:uncharacterized protein PGTG_18813 [Puccinia graminis f. sp. tritici CRL 75-36-700-3]EFP92895.2 hypothetical protein PGTG_18813 [Puccinia graminis f. sp. tritici CRL 75-36-700-3]